MRIGGGGIGRPWPARRQESARARERTASQDFADGERVRLDKDAEGTGGYGKADGLARGMLSLLDACFC